MAGELRAHNVPLHNPYHTCVSIREKVRENLHLGKNKHKNRQRLKFISCLYNLVLLTHSVRCHTDHVLSTSMGNQAQVIHYPEPNLQPQGWNGFGSNGNEFWGSWRIHQQVSEKWYFWCKCCLSKYTNISLLIWGINSEKDILSSTGQVHSDPPPVFILCWGIDGTLSVTGTADSWGNTLWGDEGPVTTTVCGVLQPYTVGKWSGLTAAHTQLKLQEGWAWDLKVPALCIPWLLCKHSVKATLHFLTFIDSSVYARLQCKLKLQWLGNYII